MGTPRPFDPRELIAKARYYAREWRSEHQAVTANVLRDLAGTLESALPHVISTREELDALPVGAIIVGRAGIPFYLHRTGWLAAGVVGAYSCGEIGLPVTVLATPGEGKS